MSSSPLSYIEINRTILRANVLQYAARVPYGTRIIAVVKANAYGHGMSEVITCVDDMVQGFQVDDIDELRIARQHTTKPIHVFGYVPLDALEELVTLGGILGVYTMQHIQALNEIGVSQGRVVPIHLKIDALLGRQGVLPSDVVPYLEMIRTSTHIRLEALYSHFSNIEDVETLDHARAQHAELVAVQYACALHGLGEVPYHISATSGFLTDQAHNWGGAYVRLGIGMYGLWPSPSLEKQYSTAFALTPGMRWVTHLAQVKRVPANYPIGYGCSYMTTRETMLGVVPQGYSDGYDRGLSNNGEVLVQGTRCPVLGRVAMNMCVVDVSQVPDVTLEDEVVLLGAQGLERITAEEIASRIGTINYEVVARTSPLLPRQCID